MFDDRAPAESLVVRVLLVLSGLSTFAVLTDALLGAPPAILTTIAFGSFLATALELQARRATVEARPRRW